MARVTDAIAGEEEVNTTVGDKINRQMSRRGWSSDDVNRTIDSPYTTRGAIRSFTTPLPNQDLHR